MFRDLLEAVRREVSGERALETVRVLARHHRLQASPGYDRASDWLAERLESHGLRVEVDSAPADGRTRLLGQIMPEGWECSRAVARLREGERAEWLCDYGAEPLSLIQRSAPASGRYPLVAVERGTEPAHYDGLDVRGRVVLADGDVHRVLELAVRQRGAAGILAHGRRLVPPVRDEFDDPDALAYTSFWWDSGEPRGWGFVVSPRVAARLRERLREGARLELEVEIESRAFATTIPLLSARLPGIAEDEVVVVSHLCHPQPSANDNASGAAANLETARALAALARRGELAEPQRGMRFLWVPELTGTCAFLASEGRSRRLAAAVNLDMVGEDQERCGSTFLLEHPPCFAASFAEELLLAIRSRALDWVSSYAGPGHYSMTRLAEVPYSGGSDHALLVDPAQGVPCPMLIQWPDRFYHSSHDTPDKCDPRSLALAARCAATYAGFLATAGQRETRWLAGLVGRGARRRMLQAMDEAEPARALERERVRARAALSSLSRLALEEGEIAQALGAFEEFERRETPAPSFPPVPGASPRPRRLLRASLPFPRRHLPGWSELPESERERWRDMERRTPDAATLSEIAWHACDGRRSLEEIAHLVRLETGRDAAAYLGEFFRLMERLGLAEIAAEEASCNPGEPHTAGR